MRWLLIIRSLFDTSMQSETTSLAPVPAVTKQGDSTH
jgi:hypothetical protein